MKFQQSLKMITVYVFMTLFLMTESSRLAAFRETDMVTEVCKKTLYFDLCMTILFTDSRKHTSDTKGLAKIVLEKDKYIATQILSEVQSLARDTGKRREIREKCGQCAKGYNGIVSKLLPAANKFLDSNKYSSSIEQLKKVANDAKSCDEQFSKANMTEPFNNMSVHDITMVAVGVIQTIT
ncbi:uncharacterized protein LOC141641791 [Silene latifolia]|uniref:uncharacterized protein LOC141641791 n=1 Tax=Silene latifolia TaxID=37657 RepID=UPI003D7797DE